ncbi:MAG TPA: hypothetical protein VG323_03430 [Thermoanaerobaculia bacterium]|nr:hypothetical protein [Thermoanaerobaculia bacterium]
MTVPLAERVMTSDDLLPADAVVSADRVAVVFVVRAVAVVVNGVWPAPTLPMPGVDATVGLTVEADDIVGFRNPPRLLVTTAAGADEADEEIVAATLLAEVGVAAVVCGIDGADAVKLAPPPEVTTGTGWELIDEFTVISGLAVSDGLTHCPVGT